MTGSRHLIAFVGLLATSAGAQQKEPMRAQKLWHQPVKVKTLGEGTAPKRQLRYKLAAGSTQRVRVVTGGRWEVHARNTESKHLWPQISYELELTVAEVNRDGIATVIVECLDAKADESGGAMLDLPSRQALLALKGTAAALLLSPRGIIERIEARPPSTDSVAQAGEAMELRSFYAVEALKSTLRQLFVALPEQAVGAGARWTAVQPVQRGMLGFIQTAAYELQAARAGAATLKVRYGGEADPADGYPPEEAKVAISGVGEAEIELTRPLPSRHQESMSIDAKLGGGRRLRSDHRGEIRVRIEPL